MSAYAIGFYDIADSSWRNAYREGTMKIVARHGGRFLVRPDCPWEVLEGNPPRPTGMDDPDDRSLIKLRQSGLDSRSYPRGESVTRHSVMHLGGLLGGV